MNRPPDDIWNWLSYDSDTGVFRWLRSPGPYAAAGSVAGTSGTRGYRIIRFRRKNYRGNRLAWLAVTGEWPELMVDHRDGDTTNDRFTNLRLATRAQNAGNQKRNRGVLKGVSIDRRGYRARIVVAGKHISLGSFETPEEAHAAYRVAAVEHFGEFARFE